MLGYNLFLEQVRKLSISKQKRLISNIFGKEVLVFSIDNFDEKIIIKFYDGDSYYQFSFIFNFSKSDDCYFSLKIRERIITCDIFVNSEQYNLKNLKNDKFCQFLKFLRDGDINLMNSFFEEDF